MIVGFPIVAYLSWILNLRIERDPKDRELSGSKNAAALALSLSLAVLAGAGFWWLSAPQDPPVGDEQENPPVSGTPAQTLPNSIAVLPLTNLSADPDDAYFAAGFHDEILSQLAKIDDLSVIARTTMMRYAQSPLSIPEIGKELNVQTVMEGSIRYAGDRVRITALLVDVQTGTTLWSEVYEDNLVDVFKLQAAIASRISGSLGAEISDDEYRRIGTKTTSSPEAYALYLQALSGWGNLADTAPIHEALDAAIALDPDFSAAIGFKAWIRVIEGSYPELFGVDDFSADDQEALIRNAELLARRALDIYEFDSRALLTMGSVYLHDHKWPEARALFESAPVSTNDYFILSSRAWGAWRWFQDADEAANYIERSIELNPADAASIWDFGVLMYWAQQWEASARHAETVTEMMPDNAFGFALLALARASTEEHEAVYRAAKQAEDNQPSLMDLAIIARAFAKIGDQREAERIFSASGAGVAGGNQNPEWQFWMYMAVGDYEAAMGYLEKAVTTNFPHSFVTDLHFESLHPDFDPIRSHPEFARLLRIASEPVRESL